MKKTEVRKLISIFAMILFECVVLVAGILFGMQNEKQKLDRESQEETVTEIAVVNLDEGIYENNQKIFYSSQLMNLEDDYLVPENLEAARQGINNGSYAAYILIPSEFSQKAVSINNIPEKAVLEFAVNPNLREDVSRLTMANIKNFEISLNTNMSYMYVQAVLSEFHNVQDMSGEIMANDSAEYQRIMEIDPQQLLEELEFARIEWASADIEEVDFDTEYEINAQITEELQDNIDIFLEESQNAFETVKEQETTVMDEMEVFYQAMEEMDIETDEEGNLVYEEGLTALSASAEEYQQQYEEQKAVIEVMLGLRKAATPTPSATPGGTASPMPSGAPDSTATPTPVPTPEISPLPPLIKDAMDSSMSEINRKISDINNENQEKIMAIQERLTQLETLLGTAQLTKPIEDQTEVAPRPTQDTTSDATKAPEESSESVPDATEAPEETPESVPDVTEPPEETPESVTVSYGTPRWLPVKAGGGFTLYAAEMSLQEQAEFPQPIAAPQTAFDYLEEIRQILQEIETVPTLTVEDIYNREAILEEFQKLVDAMDALPVMDGEAVSSILEEQILGPLTEEIAAENIKLQEAGSKYMEALDAYMEELTMYDPYDYYDYEKMGELVSTFADNMYELEEKAYETHESYLDYVYDTVDTANENMETLEEDLETAYQGTVENVQEEVDLAKGFRQEMNETNTAILGSFQDKLPYTRIGNLEYVQAYDFMVKPIKMTDASIVKQRTVILQDFHAMRNILIALVVLLIISLLSLLILKMREEKSGF